MSDEELAVEKKRLERSQSGNPKEKPWSVALSERLDVVEKLMVKRGLIEGFQRKDIGLPSMDKGV